MIPITKIPKWRKKRIHKKTWYKRYLFTNYSYMNIFLQGPKLVLVVNSNNQSDVRFTKLKWSIDFVLELRNAIGAFLNTDYIVLVKKLSNKIDRNNSLSCVSVKNNIKIFKASLEHTMQSWSENMLCLVVMYLRTVSFGAPRVLNVSPPGELQYSTS